MGVRRIDLRGYDMASAYRRLAEAYATGDLWDLIVGELSEKQARTGRLRGLTLDRLNDYAFEAMEHLGVEAVNDEIVVSGIEQEFVSQIVLCYRNALQAIGVKGMIRLVVEDSTTS